MAPELNQCFARLIGVGVIHTPLPQGEMEDKLLFLRHKSRDGILASHLGMGQKLTHQGTAGCSHCFHFPGQPILGTDF